MTLSSVSPVFAKLHALDEEERAASQERADHAKEIHGTSSFLMHLLQNVSSNPMEAPDPAQATRLLQGLGESISRVDQDKKMVDLLQDIKQSLQLNGFLQASKSLGNGERATFLRDTFQISAHAPDGVSYEIPEGSLPAEVRIDIFNSKGQKVHTTPGETTTGKHALDTLVASLKPGTYRIQAIGVDAKEELVEIHTLVTSPVKSLENRGEEIWASFENDTPATSLRKLREIYSQTESISKLANLQDFIPTSKDN